MAEEVEEGADVGPGGLLGRAVAVAGRVSTSHRFLGSGDDAREDRVVQCFLAAEEVGGGTAGDAGGFSDLLQARAVEAEPREVILGGDQDRLSCPFRVTYAFRGFLRYELRICHAWSPGSGLLADRSAS